MSRMVRFLLDASDTSIYTIDQPCREPFAPVQIHNTQTNNNNY